MVAVGWPRFGLIELDAQEARFFLYKNAKVEYTGKLNWSTGAFKTSMFVEVMEAPRVTAKQATAQRAGAMRKLATAR